MVIDEYIAQLELEGDLLIEAAEVAGPDAPVPTCPGWQVRDLLWHIGGVHRWATSFVRDQRPDPADPVERSFFAEPPDEDLGAWFRDGHAALVATLRTADPDVRCWSFLPAPSPLAFWARRQAHETAIHRIDAQSAAGSVTPVTPELASDGLAELLECFHGRPHGRLVADPPVTLGVHAIDTDAFWTVHIGPNSRRVSTTVEPADLVLHAPASSLYTLLWNRSELAGVSADGDLSVLRLWRERALIVWN